MKKGKLYVISGASGAGKNTVINWTMKLRPELFYSISATTRKPREGEVDGVNYYFLDKEKFEEMIGNGEFLEHARYVDNYYGTPKAPIMKSIEAGTDAILDIDVQGAMQIKEKLPEAVLVFILPPKFSDLEARIRGRSAISDEEVAKRLETARGEYAWADKYDYIVVNDIREEAAQELLTIMKAESYRADCRREYMKTDRD